MTYSYDNYTPSKTAATSIKALNTRVHQLYAHFPFLNPQWGIEDIRAIIVEQVNLFLKAHPEKPNVHPKIEQAADLLDAVLGVPTWDEVIDPLSFDIGHGSACVLGQTASKQLKGDGTVPWTGYGLGRQTLMRWLDNNLEAAEKFGKNYDKIVEVFDTQVGNLTVDSQNVHWLLLLGYRRNERERQRVEEEAKQHYPTVNEVTFTAKIKYITDACYPVDYTGPALVEALLEDVKSTDEVVDGDYEVVAIRRLTPLEVMALLQN